MTRSGRCYACAKRKTKCDEGVPQCQKCIKRGKSCPGYPDRLELVFQDMTWYTKNKVESRVQNVQKARVQETECIPRFFEATDWRETAVAHFYTDYCVSSDAVPYTLTVLKRLCKSSEASICLQDALHATAFVSQANQHGLEWMATEAIGAYGRALASFAKALQDPEEVVKDTLLATPYLLGLYEAISGYLPRGVLMDHHYHDGQMSLLGLHASRKIISPMGRDLYAIMHEKAIIKCLTRHKMPLEIADDCMKVLGRQGPPQEISGINICTAQLCAEAQILFDSGKKFYLLKIIQDALALDVQYQNWIEKCSNSEVWAYRTFCISPNESLPANGMVQVYHDIWTAHIWTSCRSKRAHLQEVLLHCLSLLGCHLGAQDLPSKLRSLSLDKNILAGSKRIIDDMVSGICATVPFMLGDINSAGKVTLEKKRMPLAGKQLLWPLHVARASTENGSETEVWIRGRLAFIDDTLGIRFGRLLANKVQREPWTLS